MSATVQIDIQADPAKILATIRQARKRERLQRNWRLHRQLNCRDSCKLCAVYSSEWVDMMGGNR